MRKKGSYAVIIIVANFDRRRVASEQMGAFWGYKYISVSPRVLNEVLLIKRGSVLRSEDRGRLERERC